MTKDLGSCPKCSSKLFRMWGELFDWDHAICPSRDCDYDVELDEMTCTDFDGSVVVIPKPRDDE